MSRRLPHDRKAFSLTYSTWFTNIPCHPSYSLSWFRYARCIPWCVRHGYQSIFVNLSGVAQLSITSGVPRHDTPARAILNPSAKQYCVLGRMIFMQLALQDFMNLYCDIEDEDELAYALPISTCYSPSDCMSRLRDMTTKSVKRSATSYTVAFPPPSRPASYLATGLCSGCLARLQELIVESRHDVWNELPGALEVLRTR